MHSPRETDARKLLKKRLGEIGSNRFVGPSEERVSFDDLAADYLRDYETNGRRSIRDARNSIRHLHQAFGGIRALEIKTDLVRRYAAERLAAGAANATVNRELAALKRMFTLATRAERLSSAPHIALLEEANARQGFVDPGDFDRLLDALPDELKDPIGFLYLSGWRVSEMRALEWRDIDLTAKVVRLRPELAKNKTARLLPLHGELLAILGRAREARRPDCRFVFHRQGIPIGEFRKSWAAACRAAGLSGLLVHDLRRSAVRNLVRAGVPERVAMALSGHKTRSIFDRYAIVRESDLAEAAEKLHAHIARSRSASVVPMTAVAGRP